MARCWVRGVVQFGLVELDDRLLKVVRGQEVPKAALGQIRRHLRPCLPEMEEESGGESPRTVAWGRRKYLIVFESSTGPAKLINRRPTAPSPDSLPGGSPNCSICSTLAPESAELRSIDSESTATAVSPFSAPSVLSSLLVSTRAMRSLNLTDSSLWEWRQSPEKALADPEVVAASKELLHGWVRSSGCAQPCTSADSLLEVTETMRSDALPDSLVTTLLIRESLSSSLSFAQRAPRKGRNCRPFPQAQRAGAHRSNPAGGFY